MALIINGQVGWWSGSVNAAPAASYLLDTYSGSTVAYSLRKLSSTHAGSAIRVRRSSDNTSQDIGFNANGDLDTTSLLSFVGAGNGFVSIWYDQSGNGNNAAQITAGNQPQIVSNGTVLTLNSKPRINFNAKSLNFTGFGSENFSIFALIKRQSTATYSGYIQNVGSSFNGFKIVSREDYNWRSTIIKYNGTSESLANSRHSLAGSLSNNRYLENWIYPNNPSVLYENNTNKAVGTTVLSGWGNNQTTSFGSLSYAGGLGGEFDFQEFIIYSSNQTSNLNGINTNLNSYYSIY